MYYNAFTLSFLLLFFPFASCVLNIIHVINNCIHIISFIIHLTNFDWRNWVNRILSSWDKLRLTFENFVIMFIIICIYNLYKMNSIEFNFVKWWYENEAFLKPLLKNRIIYILWSHFIVWKELPIRIKHMINECFFMEIICICLKL